LVEDIRSVVDELRSRGLVFEEYDVPGLKTTNGIAWIGDHQSAWFKDSEGNTLSLDQPPAGWSEGGRSGTAG
jgi:hypothetical protein